jgi:hypothetical protein
MLATYPGEFAMLYRLNLLDAENTVTSTTEINCTSDERAIALVFDILPECVVEVWRDDRLVIRHEASRHRV